MHMRPGGPSGGAGAPYGLPVLTISPVYADAVEMAEHADQTLAMVDEHRLAVEEVIAGERDFASRGSRHRRAPGYGNIQAAVGRPWFAVEGASQSESAGAAPLTGSASAGGPVSIARQISLASS